MSGPPPPPGDPAFAPLAPEQRARTQERHDKARQQLASAKPDHAQVHAMLLAVLMADPGNAAYVQTMTEQLRAWRGGGRLAGWLDALRGRDKQLEQHLAAGRWGAVMREGLPRLGRESRNPRLIRALAEACVGAGAFGAALVWLRFALEVFPADGPLHRHVARLLGDIGRFDQAIQCWRRLVDLVGPDDEAADMITRLSFEKAHGRSRTARLLPSKEAPTADEWRGLLRSGQRRRRAGRSGASPAAASGPTDAAPAGPPVDPDTDFDLDPPAADRSSASDAPGAETGDTPRPWSAGDTGEMSRQVLDALTAGAGSSTEEDDAPIVRSEPRRPRRPLLPSALAARQAAEDAGAPDAAPSPAPDGATTWGLPQDRDPGHAPRKVDLTPRQELEDRLRDEPRIPELYVQLAGYWEEEGNLDQARRAVQRGLEACGSELALVEREEEIRLRQAEQQLQIALRHAETDASRATRDWVADLRGAFNRVERDVLAARRDRHPTEPFWTLELAVRHKRARDFEAALALLAEILDGTPLAARVDLERGEALQHLSRFDEAVEAYRRSVAATDPAGEIGLLAAYRLGVLLSALARYDEARPVFEGLLAVRKEYRDARSRLDNLPPDGHNA